MLLKCLEYFPPPLTILFILSEPVENEQGLNSLWPEQIVTVIQLQEGYEMMKHEVNRSPTHLDSNVFSSTTLIEIHYLWAQSCGRLSVHLIAGMHEVLGKTHVRVGEAIVSS